MRRLMAATVGLMALALPAKADTSHTIGTPGSWRVFVATDPMTDKQWYGATALSRDGNDLQMDCSPYSPTKIGFMFVSKEYLGDGFRDTMYRADDKPAHTVTASYADKHFFLLCDGPCKPDNLAEPNVTLVSQIMGASKLMVRAKDYRYNNIELSFWIDGSKEAIKQITDGCKALHNDLKYRIKK